MRIFKCDRCGCEIETPNYAIIRIEYKETSYDLCANCISAVEEFIKGKGERPAEPPTEEKTRKAYTRMTDEIRAQIYKMHGEGISQAQIAERLSIGNTSVYRVLSAPKKAEIKTLRDITQETITEIEKVQSERKYALEKSDVLDLLRQGLNRKEIADKIGCKISDVTRFIIKNKLAVSEKNRVAMDYFDTRYRG